MEHRGLLGALSIAVISLGASLLIAYGTASYARGEEFDWGSGYVNVGEALVLAGVILLVATAILTERQKWRLRRIAAFTGTGNDLMDKLEVSITDDASAVPLLNLNLQIIAWAQSVDQWLEKYLPQYAKHFRNRGDQVDLIWNAVPPEGARNFDTATYAVCMSMLSGHLRRLADITMKM